ncbi:PREDICTED: alkaline phosphatase-like [Branchiostoma belcheri]|uniref:Alkaline phosphatase n=1 Tax=Branchiostoma belcheri TaxID=7741 RepID=A0A6P5AIL4_BRABE|nr:PREDICTED: alkaline phosphatase-like [Branchiostoma belcheri]
MATVRMAARLFLVAVFIATAFGKPAYDDSSDEDHSAHLLARSAHAQSRATAPTDQERTPEYWSDMARASLAAALRLQTLNTNVAKNVVLFLGDGMGVSTVTTARILKGQKAGNPGEETVLAMDSLPYTAMSKTYNIDAQVPDSAGTATAFLCGVKVEGGVVGVDGRTRYGNCSSSKGREVESIIVHAERAGKSTGIVTTARVTHATPSPAYAHSAARGWEADSDLTAEARDNNCTDIAYQLVEEAPDIEVIMGGGRRKFTPRSMADPESGSGDRDDGVDLIQRWQDSKSGTARYVWNGTDFRNVDPDSTDYLLGLFESSHMKFSADRTSDPAEEPTIADMTRKAIQILQKNTNGFFLLVEGGRIDHGHHGATAVKALEETVALDDAVQVAKDMLSTSDSLIVVTADHSHTLAFAGYPDRGHPIFGKNVYKYSNPDYTWDGLPYTTLLYGNGAGYGLAETTRGNTTHVTRQNITDVNTADKEYRQQSAVPLQSATHAGEDVIIMADGPMAHLFHGVQEQHYIAHVMMYAACLGEYTDHCDKPATTKPATDAGAAARGSLYTVGLTAVLCGLQILAATRF